MGRPSVFAADLDQLLAEQGIEPEIAHDFRGVFDRSQTFEQVTDQARKARRLRGGELADVGARLDHAVLDFAEIQGLAMLGGNAVKLLKI